MNIRTSLFDPAGRLRSGWRFITFCALFFVAVVLIVRAGFASLQSMGVPLQSGTPTFLIANAVLMLIPALLAGWICGKYLEGLPFRALGVWFTRRWHLNLILGFLLGGLSLALAAALGNVFGGLTFSVNAAASTSQVLITLAWSFVVFAVASAFEEVLFRGYILQTFTRSDLTGFGVMLSSLLFATVHNANPSATPLSWANTFIAGVWFAIAYLRTRDLWLPFALHLAWNWTQGSIFGVEVSGMTTIVTHPVLREADSGPAWITGGEYGVEGGIITTIALIVSTVAINYLPILKPDDEMVRLTSDQHGSG